MASYISATGKFGDLFGEGLLRGNGPVIERRPPPELTMARMLCRQLKHKQTHADKKRIVHLICLNLQTMLRHGSQFPERMRTEQRSLGA